MYHDHKIFKVNSKLIKVYLVKLIVKVIFCSPIHHSKISILKSVCKYANLFEEKTGTKLFVAAYGDRHFQTNKGL